MESPKRPATGCEVQGSPIFKFLCTLSPIKQAKSVHVAQTYSELSFPAPPAVFASPSGRTGKKQCSLPPAKTQNPAPGQDSKASNSVQDEEQDKVSTASQANMRGARRRCLDFDDSQTSHSAVTDDGQDIELTPTCSDITMPSIVDPKETDATTTSEALADVVTPGVCPVAGGTPGTTTTCTQTIFASVSLKNGTGSSDSCASSETFSREGGGIPAGIGLHLNSLTSSLGLLPRGVSLQSLCAPTEMQSAMPDIPATSGLNFRPNLLLSVIEKTRTDEREFGSQDAVIKSTTCVRALTLGIQAIDERVPFDIDKVVTPGRKRLSLLEEPADEPSRTPPKKKRRSSSDKYGDGCKRCHCKKSKCLKLYCECFAAGVYCLDSCACRDCFNKPEFAETVLGTRQQIETRNPLAFAPKIVQTTDCVQAEGASCSDTTTTTSARHKRGCNCKKSLCLKKYCECYQAGVGCSDGCRCNGCKNIYGIKKPEPEETELDDHSVDLIRSTISPITPFQQTPGVDMPPDSSALSRTIYGTTARSFGMDSNGLFPSPIIEQQPSPCWEGVDDISTITPLVQHPLRPPPSSSLVKVEPATSACPVRFVSSSTPSSSPISKLSKLMDSESLLSDETPEFMKEDPSPPRTLVKGGSPKQKRVLPPNMLLSSSSGGGLLRSGRKLNLSTLPSLPPVTHFSFMHQQQQQQQGGRS